MEGNYPIIIKGENCGSLSVKKEGAYTRFIADCAEWGGIIRLSVYGGGIEGYLGVPLPKDGRLHLDKKLSPAAMRAFPGSIERCSLAGEKEEKTELNYAEECAPEECCEKCEEKVEMESEHEKSDCVEECEKGEEATFWYATTDGALVSRDGDREMVALPPEDERVPKDFPGQPRIIEGKEYLVYITKEM